MEPTELERRLKEAFPGAEVEISDLTGTKDHFQARIVAEEFTGQSLIQQHQMVYRVLEDAMRGAIHALALRTYTPKSWGLAKGIE
ncbi:MAG: BolA family transcriptional regulator [Polyangiaceae bacterium]|nr:BolA family transcriptional regulator [Polyangiaceae bacterium]